MKKEDDNLPGAESTTFKITINKDFLDYKKCILPVDPDLEGTTISKKQIHKTITDLKNKYKSHLRLSLSQEVQNIKLDKRVDEEKIIDLKARIEVLEELERKLNLKT